MTNNGLFNNVFSWFKDRWFKIPEHDSKVYNLTLLSMVLANIASVVIIALANPTGINFLLDFIIYLLLTTIAFYIFTILFAFLLSLLYLPLPRLSIGSIVFTWALAYYILSLGDLGRLFSIVVSFSFILISMIIGAIGIILFSKQLSLKIKILALVLPMLIIVLIYRIPFFKKRNPLFLTYMLSGHPILDESPAKAGDFL